MMAHQEATTVVPQPLGVVYERLRDVESWPNFLEGLLLATMTGHQRYRFVVRSGRSTREVAVAVIPHVREHRFTWKALAGPRYEGEIRLSSPDEGHTRVRLSLTSDPVGFLAGIEELFGRHQDEATVDLARLRNRLGTTSA